MFFFHLFRSFLPLHNPIGFGVADFIEFTLAVLFFLFTVIWNPCMRSRIARFSGKTGYAMLALALLPIVLRLVLLPKHPVPAPGGPDEFSHLLVADTLLHFRLANPMHPLHQFFETLFVLQQPTYSSIYSLGEGMTLAFGRLVSGSPWAGVVLSVAAFCAFSYWMLRAWTTPIWALAGGLLAVIEFGPLNSWMNSYYGGAFAATAGCLVFGALPRVWMYARKRDAAVLGVGFGMHLLTRSFESTLLALSIVLFLAPMLRTAPLRAKLRRVAPIALLALATAVLLLLAHNKAVTHSWTTLPEQLSQYQYGVPTTLTIQAPPVPHNTLTPEQAIEYRGQTLTHGPGTDTLSHFFLRLEYRVRYYRFFFLAPLYLAIIAFFFALREKRFIWVAVTLAIFALGTNLFPYLLVHYLAGVTCLFLLVTVIGLQQLSRLHIASAPIGRTAARIILFLCGAHFVFWYGLHLFENGRFAFAIADYETWDMINHRVPDRRAGVQQQLASLPGKQKLVFVRYYWPEHPYQDEWVWNTADIDRSPTVFARDLGPVENQKLRQYFSNRTVWLLEPDFRPPRLSRYQ